MKFQAKSGDFKCGCGCGKDVEPQLKEVANKIDNLFIVAGLGEMSVTSAARCHAYNMQVGGIGGDAHEQGLAIDMACSDGHLRFDMTKILTAEGILRLGISAKDSFIHWDIATNLPQKDIWIY